MKRVRLQLNLFGSPEDRELSEQALRHMLEALTLANQIYIRSHPDTPSPFDHGVRYEQEPAGSEDWNAIPYIGTKADCEDLAAYLAAWMREKLGIAATAIPLPPKLVDGVLLYHIVVQTPDGKIVDPSRGLGMKVAA